MWCFMKNTFGMSVHSKEYTIPVFLLLPNVAVVWLTLLLCILEVLGSNVGPEIGYPDWGLSILSNSRQANAGIVPK
jgi:hypothetical protein